MTDALGFFGFVFNVAGNLLLTRRNAWGWWVRLVAIVAWLGYSVMIRNGPLFMNSLVFTVINGWGAWQWRKTS